MFLNVLLNLLKEINRRSILSDGTIDERFSMVIFPIITNDKRIYINLPPGIINLGISG